MRSSRCALPGRPLPANRPPAGMDCQGRVRCGRPGGRRTPFRSRLSGRDRPESPSHLRPGRRAYAPDHPPSVLGRPSGEHIPTPPGARRATRGHATATEPGSRCQSARRGENGIQRVSPRRTGEATACERTSPLSSSVSSVERAYTRWNPENPPRGAGPAATVTLSPRLKLAHGREPLAHRLNRCRSSSGIQHASQWSDPRKLSRGV